MSASAEPHRAARPGRHLWNLKVRRMRIGCQIAVQVWHSKGQYWHTSGKLQLSEEAADELLKALETGGLDVSREQVN